jgi:vesicle coat complex subunit
MPQQNLKGKAIAELSSAYNSMCTDIVSSILSKFKSHSITWSAQESHFHFIQMYNHSCRLQGPIQPASSAFGPRAPRACPGLQLHLQSLSPLQLVDTGALHALQHWLVLEGVILEHYSMVSRMLVALAHLPSHPALLHALLTHEHLLQGVPRACETLQQPRSLATAAAGL